MTQSMAWQRTRARLDKSRLPKGYTQEPGWLKRD